MSKEVEFKNRDRFIQLGIAIAALRKMRGMSQEKLAELSNVSRSHISAIEAPGIVRPFSLEVFYNIADALDIDPADLINASKYRGIGGRGSSASSFTVLEIQPCYPIDEAVAQEVGKAKPRSGNASSIYGSGNYYTAPANVVNGKTKEQLAENTEYYAWELSKAKLADALNLPIDKINLVQMSSEEFACDKSEVV